MPATKVPWPRPSPAELFASDVRLTLATMRPAKSAREASIPESTMAIVGVAADIPFAQNFWTPETKGQRCLLESVPASWIWESVVIAAIPVFCASLTICAPVRLAATPLTEENCRLMPLACPGLAETVVLTTDAMAPVDLSGSPWMITLNVAEGLAFADTRSPGVVYA